MIELHFNGGQKIITNFLGATFTTRRDFSNDMIDQVLVQIQQGNDIVDFLKANPDNLTISTFKNGIEQNTKLISGTLSDISDIISQTNGTIISQVVINGTITR